MSIEQQLRNRLKDAMRAKDRRTADVIKMISSRVIERTKEKGFKGEVDDALYLDVIGAYKKQMEKAKVEFEKAGERGAENADQAQFEVDFCAEYLPKQLGEAEVRDVVKTAIASLGATDPKMVGRVVGAVMKDHRGLVDAGLVKQIATEELGG